MMTMDLFVSIIGWCGATLIVTCTVSVIVFLLFIMRAYLRGIFHGY